MNKLAATVGVTIDGKTLLAQRGASILDVARSNNIYIPTLCAHKDLTPFGGCRVCIVEVEGMRNFPTACTTIAEEGMVIRTDSPQIQAERTEILRLILSEHPSSCLICDERGECKQFMGTIRKVGATTGCRYCPGDGQCVLQKVVEKSGLTDIGYPIRYRRFPVERNDPFYDRDYNLCILCGRCVRICSEVRGSHTLAFKMRGPDLVVGPAYERTHMEAGCEFCGDCLTVCPTGALSEKVRKWQGVADRDVKTTCCFCGVGCQLHLSVKDEKIIGSLPAHDLIVNDGRLCVKGRFCVPELVHHHKRLKKPWTVEHGRRLDISWNEAFGRAADNLSRCDPNRFAMLVSPNCCNEDLYVAQKFVRVAMDSHHIDTSARLFYGPSFGPYTRLLNTSAPLSEIGAASIILCIGLDTRFGRSVVGVQLRNAARRGSKIVSIHHRRHNIEMVADETIYPMPGMEASFLESLVDLTTTAKTKANEYWSDDRLKGFQEQASKIADMLKEASHPLVVLGPEYLTYDDSPRIVESVARLAHNVGAGVVILPSHNNLVGSLLMGTYPEMIPGGFSVRNPVKREELRTGWGIDPRDFSTGWTSAGLLEEVGMQTLYLVGESPPTRMPPVDFLIFQNIYPPDQSIDVDLVLPSACFGEVDGTFLNGDGRIQRVRKAVEPPGDALPDWKILCKIAQVMGKRGFEFADPGEIHEEIAALVPGFGNFEDPNRKPLKIRIEDPLESPRTSLSALDNSQGQFPLTLIASSMEHTYLGAPLSNWVEGARRIFTVGVLEMNPEDAEEAGISDGDQVEVASAFFEKMWTARIVGSQRPGIVNVTLTPDELTRPNPAPVRIRRKNV